MYYCRLASLVLMGAGVGIFLSGLVDVPVLSLAPSTLGIIGVVVSLAGAICVALTESDEY